MENKQVYENYLHQIDTLDSEIIYLLHRRLEIIKQLKTLTATNTDFSNDFLNFENILSQLTPIAEDLCVDQDLVKNIWSEINNKSQEI